MKKEKNRSRSDKGMPLLLSIVIVFSILGVVVFSVSHKISKEMTASAVQNLNESLDLIECTIEAIFNKEAEFQKLMAQEIALASDMEAYICSYQNNQTMVKVSLICTGETVGISNTGETFSQAELDFSSGKKIEGLPISKTYINYMGAWAYTMKCPVQKDGQEVAVLYIEYTFDSLDKSLPNGFYNQKAMLYIMDAETERFVLKPKGMGVRDAGHLNLEDFYRANDIYEEDLMAEVTKCLENNKNILYYHKVLGENALNYMWAVNDGAHYLIGYVPIEAIQQEGDTVNQNIYIVVAVMLVAFFLCCVLYYFSQRQQNKIRKEREIEREIYNKQLAEALQAAQIASNSKTMFLSNMSHDIRTPMNAVLGFTTLLAKDAENPEKVREYTKKITASGQHLLSLINDILDVSKIESGKVVLTMEEFTLNDLVSSVDAIIRPMANNRNQTFYVQVTGIQHEYLVGDETRINQILINLLSNAVKYTPEGGDIWFRIIGLKQHSSQFEHIRIEVEDNGYGMTPEYLTTIFDAFTRAENSTTNKVQGTGLGMAITKNIVELMGGSIDVVSEVDKGSIFRVELELRISENETYKQFWKENGISRILVVSSDTEECANISLLMKESEVDEESVPNLQETLVLLRQKHSALRYQMILIDWETVKTDEIASLRELRELVSEGVPILFGVSCTGNSAEEAQHEEILGIPNTGILTKPFFVSACQEKILDMHMQQNGSNTAESAERNNLSGLHFLAAEDNDINAEILIEILSIEGAACEVVENGRMVVERFASAAKGEFDAILMDVQMPVMNGYDATRAIRALPREDAVTIPIIAMTANAFAEDEKEALEAGMNIHLAKPIDIELLKKVIYQCVQKK